MITIEHTKYIRDLFFVNAVYYSDEDCRLKLSAIRINVKVKVLHVIYLYRSCIPGIRESFKDKNYLNKSLSFILSPEYSKSDTKSPYH